jgi:hypothetical protein
VPCYVPQTRTFVSQISVSRSAVRRQSDLADFVLLAAKAALHHYLYLRHAYPVAHFRAERVLGTFTQACRHHAVKAYVSEALDSIKARSAPQCFLSSAKF